MNWYASAGLINAKHLDKGVRMAQRVWRSLMGIFFLALFSTEVWAQNPVRINWTAVTGAQSGIFMAAQENLFKKYGLDVELIHIPSSSRGIQAILAGEISFSFMDGSNVAQANLKGAKPRAYQLDSRNRGTKRIIHGSSRKALQKIWARCRADSYSFQL